MLKREAGSRGIVELIGAYYIQRKKEVWRPGMLFEGVSGRHLIFKLHLSRDFFFGGGEGGCCSHYIPRT